MLIWYLIGNCKSLSVFLSAVVNRPVGTDHSEGCQPMWISELTDRDSPMTATDSSQVDLVGAELTRNIVRAALFAALLGAFSQVSFSIPLSPAPITLQLLGVYLAGILLGPVWGAGACVLYLLAGAIGAPVFANGAAGFGVMLGPTGGYLWSMPIAALIIGMFIHGSSSLVDPAQRGVGRLFAGLISGTVVIYACGVLGMIVLLDFTVQGAITAGALVFLPGEALKIAAAIGIVRSDAITAS